jgi:hypothetical protein
MIVNATVTDQVIRAFRMLCRDRFPIRRMQPVDAFGGSDQKSMAADTRRASLTPSGRERQSISSSRPAAARHSGRERSGGRRHRSTTDYEQMNGGPRRVVRSNVTVPAGDRKLALVRLSRMSVPCW